MWIATLRLDSDNDTAILRHTVFVEFHCQTMWFLFDIIVKRTRGETSIFSRYGLIDDPIYIAIIMGFYTNKRTACRLGLVIYTQRMCSQIITQYTTFQSSTSLFTTIRNGSRRKIGG